MWTEEMGARAGQLSEHGEERRLLSARERGQRVEHGIHEREGLGLLREVTGTEERHCCA